MRRREGQAAIFDAVAFMAIMLVASSLMFAYSATLSREARALEAADDIAYAQEMLQSVLRATVTNASYELNGTQVTRGGQASVEVLLIEELSLLDDGVPGASFGGGYHGGVARAANATAGQFRWALEGRYAGAGGRTSEFRIGQATKGARAAASVSPRMISGKSGRATVTRYIWRE